MVGSWYLTHATNNASWIFMLPFFVFILQRKMQGDLCVKALNYCETQDDCKLKCIAPRKDGFAYCDNTHTCSCFFYCKRDSSRTTCSCSWICAYYNSNLQANLISFLFGSSINLYTCNSIIWLLNFMAYSISNFSLIDCVSIHLWETISEVLHPMLW